MSKDNNLLAVYGKAGPPFQVSSAARGLRMAPPHAFRLSKLALMSFKFQLFLIIPHFTQARAEHDQAVPELAAQTREKQGKP